MTIRSIKIRAALVGMLPGVLIWTFADYFIGGCIRSARLACFHCGREVRSFVSLWRYYHD
jgi:hypothetical protein